MWCGSVIADSETRIIVKDAKSIEFEMESLAFECVEVEREILVA